MILHLSMAFQATEAHSMRQCPRPIWLSRRGEGLWRGELLGKYLQGTTRMEGVHA